MLTALFIPFSPSRLLVSKIIPCYFKPFFIKVEVFTNDRCI